MKICLNTAVKTHPLLQNITALTLTLSVERTLTGSKGTQTETISPTLIQVDGFWYILQENTTAADSQQTTE